MEEAGTVRVVDVDQEDVVEDELTDGVMRVAGRLQEGIEPFETRLRVGFHDQGPGKVVSRGVARSDSGAVW